MILPLMLPEFFCAQTVCADNNDAIDEMKNKVRFMLSLQTFLVSKIVRRLEIIEPANNLHHKLISEAIFLL